ncbi:MAG: prepilin peptidase [Sphingobium sp.]|nr:prepilin peptidase [Sphingobium sp.]
MAAIGLGLGLIFGSFLGALVVRWPQGRSVLGGRSVCDGCGRPLSAWELVPLLSFMLCRGRCRSCGGQIDKAHILMEAGCGVIGTAAMILAGQAVMAHTFMAGAVVAEPVMHVLLAALPLAAAWMVLGWALLTLALLDARYYWLPDAITLPLLFLGLTIGPWVTGVTLQDALIGAAIGYGSLLVVAMGYRRLRGRDGLGLGDAKLLGALGAWMGCQVLPFILLLASVAALLWVIGRKIMGADINATTRIAFGTFLCMAALPAQFLMQHLLMRG